MTDAALLRRLADKLETGEPPRVVAAVLFLLAKAMLKDAKHRKLN